MGLGNKRALVVAISGGSGSGKTTIAHNIRQNLPPHVKSVVLYQDNYYLDQSDIPFERRVKNNYDTPKAFDWKLMKQHLADLIAGKPIESPVYDFENHTRSSKKILIQPVDVVIFEGFMTLHEEVLRLSDVKIFIDTPSDERVLRRMMRDISERGRTPEQVAVQWRSTVRPMYRTFVAPQKEVAHIIIPWYEMSPATIQIVRNAIVHHVDVLSSDHSAPAPAVADITNAESKNFADSGDALSVMRTTVNDVLQIPPAKRNFDQRQPFNNREASKVPSSPPVKNAFKNQQQGQASRPAALGQRPPARQPQENRNLGGNLPRNNPRNLPNPGQNKNQPGNGSGQNARPATGVSPNRPSVQPQHPGQPKKTPT